MWGSIKNRIDRARQRARTRRSLKLIKYGNHRILFDVADSLGHTASRHRKERHLWEDF